MTSSAVVFDIDGTLCPEVSWSALTRDLGASVDKHTAIFDAYRLGNIEYATAKHELIGLWQKTGKANYRDFLGLFNGWPLDPAASQVIDELKQRNFAVCLITGSFDLYAQAVAKRLGVSHYFANTQLVFGPNGNLQDFHYHLEQGEVKLQHLRQFCRQQGIHPGACYTVGNGENDYEIFTATAHGILLLQPEQSEHLRSSAWKTANSLREVLGLIPS